jgi:calcineurin-like phosphoesterase family protein
MKDLFYKSVKIKSTDHDVLFWGCMHYGHDPKWDVPIWKTRGYNSSFEHDEGLIQNWNKKAGASTIGFLLGDTIFGHNADERLINLFTRLDFKELYVLPGNHQAGYKQLIERVQDNILLPTASEYKQVHFVPNYLEAVVNGQSIIMNHYAQATWNGQHKGAWHLHSHSHGNLYKSELGKLLYKSKTMDVGVEVCSEPISFAELRAKFRGYDQITFDHHK